jgi:2-keto-4-pentenoate hydratase
MSFPTARLAEDPRVRVGMSAQLDSRARRLRSGDRPLGWKLGFGSAAARAELGLAAPLIGFLTRSLRLEPSSTVSLGGWSNPILEPEVAIRLAVPLGPDADRPEIEAAVAGVGPAFELVDVHPPPVDVEAILAGNVFSRHVVLGAARTDVDLGRLGARVSSGAPPPTLVDRPWALTGDPIGLIGHLADLLAPFGIGLEAGEVIICGSIVPPIGVAPGDRFEYALDPIGEIAIGFEA